MIESYQNDFLKDFTSWFEILVELSKNTSDTSSLPKLEVSLRSGRQYTGYVIGLKKSVQENVLMLLEDHTTTNKSSIHLLYCDEISVLTFTDPLNLMSLLESKKTAISELELKRRSQKVEEQIELSLSKKIPISLQYTTISEFDRNYIIQLIEALPQIFENISKDNLGKNQILESVDDIEILMGKTTETSLQNKILVCMFSNSSQIFISKQKETLLQSIEKVL